jgi:hypothetical protein
MDGIQNQFNQAHWQTDYAQQPELQSPRTLKGTTASGDSGVLALQIDVEGVFMWFWSVSSFMFSSSINAK